MKIKIFTTGGTIDKDYDKKAGTYNFEISEPAIKNILENINPNFQYDIQSILKKDSLEVTNQERQKILGACEKELSNKIIITHGTDTMLATAKKLSTLKNKVIILLGAQRPAKFIDSDAGFNVGIAIGAIDTLNEGVYIAMHGRVLSWDKLSKNPDTGRFEQIN